MTLRDAILEMLRAHEDGRLPAMETLAFLREQVREPQEIWGVQDPDDESEEPCRISYGTTAEMDAWHHGFEFADGFPEATAFETEEEAFDHINSR